FMADLTLRGLVRARDVAYEPPRGPAYHRELVRTDLQTDHGGRCGAKECGGQRVPEKVLRDRSIPVFLLRLRNHELRIAHDRQGAVDDPSIRRIVKRRCAVASSQGAEHLLKDIAWARNDPCGSRHEDVTASLPELLPPGPGRAAGDHIWPPPVGVLRVDPRLEQELWRERAGPVIAIVAGQRSPQGDMVVRPAAK